MNEEICTKEDDGLLGKFISSPKIHVSVYHEKRQARKKVSAEDFTPSILVNEMLDKFSKEQWQDGKTFCDPAAGNGNILIEVLKRKLSLNHNPLTAIQSIYGADIMQDNIRECRERLLTTLKEHTTITKDMVKAVLKNIVWTPLKKYPNGSLDYDFDFAINPKQRDIDRWYDQMSADIIDQSKSEEEELEVEEVEERNLWNSL